MPERISAHDTITGERAYVPWRWVDNPGIKNGRYVSEQADKTSRSKRGPVDNKKVADVVAAPANMAPAAGDSTKETS